MYKKSRGTTLVEVLVSVALISIVLIFVFNILADLKNEYSLASKRSEDAIKRASYTRIIQNDFIAKELVEVSSCPSTSDILLCLNFKYKDGSTKLLNINKQSVVYDNEIWKLSTGEYKIEDAMICYKKIDDIINLSSLSETKKSDVILNSDKYHLLKIIVPATSAASSNKKYNFEIIHISPYNLDVSIDGYNSIVKCN